MVFSNSKRKPSRAQAAVETLVILGIGLFILTSLVAMVYDQINSDYVAQQQKQGTSAARILVKEINDAYFLGSGTVKSVVLRIPELTDLNRSSIVGNTLLLNVGGTDFIFSTDVNIVGSWPNEDGSYVFVITAYDNFVSLSTQAASFSPSEVSKTLVQNTSVDVNVLFTNVTDHSVSYVVEPEEISGGSISYSGGTVNVSAGNSRAMIFTVGCDRNFSGSVFGNIVLASQNSSDINMTIPVRLFCSSAQTKLNIFPVSKVISANDGIDSNDSVLVCNSSKSDFSNTVSQITGGISQYVFTSFSGTISANTCRTITLDVINPQLGSYYGELIVSAGGFTAVSDVNLNVS